MSKKTVGKIALILWVAVIIIAIVCFKTANIDALICVIAAELVVSSVIIYTYRYMGKDVTDDVLTPKRVVFIKDVIISLIFLTCLTSYLLDVFSSDRKYLLDELRYRVDSIETMNHIDLSEFSSDEVKGFVDNIELAPRSSILCLTYSIGVFHVADSIAAILIEVNENGNSEEALKNVDFDSLNLPTVHTPYTGNDEVINGYSELISKIPATVIGVINKESSEEELDAIITEMSSHVDMSAKKLMFDVLILVLIRICSTDFFKLVIRTVACLKNNKRLFC